MDTEYGPPSLLGRRRRFEPITILGLLVTLLLHGGAVVGVLLYRRARRRPHRSSTEEPSYVVAKLVKLGKPLDEKKMPDKVVPQPATKQEEGLDLGADASDAPAKRKRTRTETPRSATGCGARWTGPSCSPRVSARWRARAAPTESPMAPPARPARAIPT